MELHFDQETFAIRGAVFEVYKEMGCGFLESVYQECLKKEFESRGIPFSEQPELHLQYKNQSLNQMYKPDFICFGQIILELKAIKNIIPENRAQIINYLKASHHKLGLLINFGSYPKVEIERYVN